jgi:hypothetical protein
MLKETMAALDLVVDLDGQTYRPKLKPGDMVRFEQHFGRSLLDGVVLDDNGDPTGIKFGITELFFLAFTSLRREGHFDGDFDAFCDRVDDVELAGGEGPKGEAA